MKGIILNANQLSDQNLSDQNVNHSKKHSESNSGSIIQFYGLLENGANFIWEIRPGFYRLFEGYKEDRGNDGRITQVKTGYQDFRKNPLHALHFNDYSAMQEWIKEEKEENDKDLFESDLQSTKDFLLEHRLTGLVQFVSEPSEIKEEDHKTYYYTNPDFKALKVFNRSVDNANFKNFEKLFKDDQPIFPFNVISLDIETGVENNLLYSVALYGHYYSEQGKLNYQKVLMLDPDLTDASASIKEEISYFSSEKELLSQLIEEFQRINPHIIVGWYVVNFDFNFLIKKFLEHQLSENLGINRLPIDYFKSDKSNELIIKIPGRVVLDGMNMVKKCYQELPNYRLNTAAEAIIGTKKTIELNNQAKVDEIDRQFREDKVALAAYNLMDTQLVYDLFLKLDGIRFYLIRSLISGTLMEKVDIPNEVFDFHYLQKLKEKNIISYNQSKSKFRIREDYGNSEFKRELYHNVCVIKLADLYPFIILSYRIDPLGMVRAQVEKDQALSTARGYHFHKVEHLLPQIVHDLYTKLNISRSKDNPIKAETIDQPTNPVHLLHPIHPQVRLGGIVWKNEMEQLLYAIYGGTSRFFLPGLGESIRENVQFVMDAITKMIDQTPELSTIYFDNECLVVQYQSSSDMVTDEGSSRSHILAKISSLINEKITPEFFKRVLPSGKMDHEVYPYPTSFHFFPKLFLLSERGQLHHRSSLEYVAVENSETDSLEIREQTKRRYNLPLVKKLIRESLEIVLTKSKNNGQQSKKQEHEHNDFENKNPEQNELDDYLKNFKADLMKGLYDNQLILRKKLTKELSEYPEQAPPQVIALRKAPQEFHQKHDNKKGFKGFSVHFQHTVDGPVCQQFVNQPLDYQYYLDKELTPELEKIFNNTRYETSIITFKSDDFQMSLF